MLVDSWRDSWNKWRVSPGRFFARFILWLAERRTTAYLFSEESSRHRLIGSAVMKHILLDQPLEETALRHLRELPGVTVQVLPARRPDEPVAPELLREKH